MTNPEILTKAIKKAIASGWQTTLAAILINWSVDSEDGAVWVNRKIEGIPMYPMFAEVIIFNHDFAKALWGEEMVATRHTITMFNGLELDSSELWLPNFKYHLQRMVVADDPIKYLGENI